MENPNTPTIEKTPIAQPSFWNENRRQLRDWFERNGSDHLGQLYEGALIILYSDKFPGRKRFVAHAVREIRNRLPDIIAGCKARKNFQWKNELDDLVGVWFKAGISLDSIATTEVTTSAAPTALIEIPREVFERIQKILKDHHETREKPIEAARRLFETIAPENKNLKHETLPIFEQWIQITRWFVSETNEGTATKNEEEADVELIKRFQIFETALVSLVGKFFKTIGGLNEILEDTNN